VARRVIGQKGPFSHAGSDNFGRDLTASTAGNDEIRPPPDLGAPWSGTRDEPADEHLYRRLEQRPGRVVAMAFVPDEHVRPRRVSGQALAWTLEAVAAFANIRQEASKTDKTKAFNLPYAYLRGALEVALPEVIRIENGMGLDRQVLDRAAEGKLKDPPIFAWVESNASAASLAALQPILDVWIDNSLFQNYADPGKVEQRLKDHVLDLAKADRLVTAEPFLATVLPWGWSVETGTARVPGEAARGVSAYRELADHAARALAGKELFRGLGPMRRVISMRSRENRASLMTAPVEIPGQGWISLVVTLKVETMPSVRAPLVVMSVSKRRWLASLKGAAFDHNRISGDVFSDSHLDRVFSFHVTYGREKGGVGRWSADNAFSAIRRTLDLPPGASGADEILGGESNRLDPDTGKIIARVLLTYRNGISKEKHAINAGVPEVDKHEAFTAAAGLLTLRDSDI
jgi:hypothetical protein